MNRNLEGMHINNILSGITPTSESLKIKHLESESVIITMLMTV